MEIPSEVLQALKLIESKGHEAYLVGGCVRDFIMKKKPYDFDITTSAKPNEVKEIFHLFTTFDQGIKHGTVGVKINKLVIEITTYRIDGEYLDARHPSDVKFTTFLIEDLKRRDFTINALALDKNYQIVDHFGGINDINNKIIKCVGDPNTRFNEDALRILRALRFASVLGFRIEEETSKAILDNYHLLEKVSIERIYSELKKFLLGKNIGFILSNYESVFELIINSNINIEYKKIDKVKSKLIQRLTYFLSGCKTKESAIKILHHLKVDKITIKNVTLLFNNLDCNISDKISIKKILRDIGKDLFVDLIDIKSVIDEVSYINEMKLYNEIIEYNECYSLAQLAINGKDLNNIGIIGKRNGEVLNYLLDMVITEKVENSKDQLLELVKTL